MLGTGVVLVLTAGIIVAGSVFAPTEGLIAVLLAEEFVLAWITLASFAHLAFVPAFCVVVAKRDARRSSVGLPAPTPTSKWKSYDSVFLDKEAA